MKKLSIKWFNKWSKKAKFANEDLLKAITNLENGLSTSNLGKYLFKIRVKRENSGKSSGFRTIVVYKRNDRAIFVYGFGKNEKENISKTELQYFKKLADDLMALNSEQIEQFIEQKVLFDLEANK